MSTKLKNLSQSADNNIPNASNMSFGIVVATWNTEITESLYRGCYETLIANGAKDSDIFTARVPGSFELPIGARLLDAKKAPDAIICLGCVIKGDTDHNEYINHAVANGLTQLSLLRSKPFIFGLLTTQNEQQAVDRAGGKHGNKGVEAANTAILMIHMSKSISAEKKKIGY